MGVIMGRCDECFREVGPDNFIQDHNGDRCRQCWLKERLRSILFSIEKGNEWLRNTHLKDIGAMKSEAEKIASELMSMSHGATAQEESTNTSE